MNSLRNLLPVLLVGGLFPIALPAQITWKRTYGGFGVDQAFGVRHLPDSGAIVVGSTGSFGAGGGDAYLFRIDSLGERLWSRTFGSVGPDQGRSVRALPAGGFVFAGSTGQGGGYDGFLVLTDDAGDALFEQVIGTSDWDFLHDVEVLPDGFLAVGTSFGTAPGAGDAWLVRTNVNGDTLWTRAFGDAWSDEGHAVRTTPDGGAVLVGSIGRQDGDRDVLVLKVDAAGNEEWREELGGDSLDVALGVALVPGGGYAVCGWSESFFPERCMYIIKLDDQGQVLWENPLATAGADWEGREVGVDALGDILVAGSTKAFGAGGADFYLLTLDTDGFYVNGPTYGGAGDDEAWSFDFCADGGFVIAGSTGSYGPGNTAVMVVRSNGQPDNGPTVEDVDPLRVPGGGSPARLAVHPNPISAGQVLTLGGSMNGLDRMELLDQGGRVVHVWRPAGPRITWPSLGPGAYLLRAIGRDGTVRLALVISH